MDENRKPSGVAAQRARRNILAMGALVVTALANLAVLKSARAGGNNNDQGNNNNNQGNNNNNQGNNNNNQGNNNQGSRSCFLRGTRIRTVEGDRKVEDLAVGDLVPTMFGGARPIQWIERYRYTRSDSSKPWANDVRPVRIARSALGPDAPHADLYLTLLHALFVDGVLVRAGDLVNGTTIMLDAADQFNELEFFHLKLESHDVIYAEGAACETLLNVDANASDFAGTLCAPLLAFNVPRARFKSRFRSAISPWIDRRQKLDIVRDRLEERGYALCKQATLTA